MTLVRSLLFLSWFAGISAVIFIAALPLFAFPAHFVLYAAQIWARLILAGLNWICGLSYEIRGKEHVPQGPALVASKHFTTWETIALLVLVKKPAIVLKRELLWIPFYGWYGLKMGMITVDRAGQARAVRKMQRAARKAIADGRQIVIFPEGTRRKLGAPPAYKPGVAGLYADLGVACVPVAHNSGRYWVPGGLVKRPGRIVVEFLPPIPPGLERREFMATLETRIEEATDGLLAEAGAKT